MSTRASTAPKVTEWERRLVQAVAVLLVFETLTGVAIYFLPFSIANQVMVLAHTLVGVGSVAPLALYQLRHWRMYRTYRLSHLVLTGYFAMAATVALMLSGLVLTWQALFAYRISPAWDLTHIVATFALIAAAVPHVVTLVARAVRGADTPVGGRTREAIGRFGRATACLTVGGFVLIAAISLAYRPPALVNALPEGYSYLFGPDRPFAPSLARTASGTAYDARSLAGSASCGTANCHKQIYDEWAVSAHRYAAMDPAFQKVQEVMAQQNGPETTRYCGGCHDPISLFSGTKNIFTEDLTGQAGFQEGVSCVACHAITETDVKGNAAYVMTQPPRYLFELDSARAARAVSEFLIRAYPRRHIATLQHKLFKSPEFCAACHKQFIDEEINRVGWVQLQNQYDNWRKSRWNHPQEPGKTIECRECHMPLADSRDPARGDDRDYNRTATDGKHRSHRFLGANQYIPSVLKLPGAEEHVRLTEQWLRGELEVPEIADKWRAGPAVPVELVVPATARPGSRITVQAVLVNNKVGHDFPTGPLDIIQSWVEVEITDQAGNVVFRSGHRDSSNFIAPGSFMFKAEPVDQYGNLIDRHNLWEMVGVRYRRALFPGFSDRESFTVTVPRRMATELRVTARVLYRKVDQFLLNFLFGETSGLTARVTVMSEDRRIIRIVAGD